MLLKFLWFLGYIVLNLLLFTSDFLKKFYNTLMIYNTRNQNNDTTCRRESEISWLPYL